MATSDCTTPTKRCSSGEHCVHPMGCWQPATNAYFSKCSARRDGFQAMCKLCQRRHKKQHYADNVDKYREYSKRYRLENAGKVREYNNRYYADNAGRERERGGTTLTTPIKGGRTGSATTVNTPTKCDKVSGAIALRTPTKCRNTKGGIALRMLTKFVLPNEDIAQRTQSDDGYIALRMLTKSGSKEHVVAPASLLLVVNTPLPTLNSPTARRRGAAGTAVGR